MDDLCIKWKNNPFINPSTGRVILESGPVYKKYQKLCETGEVKETLDKVHCNIWKADPEHNPITKRKLNTSAKNGIYAQLVKLCEMTKKTPSIAAKPIAIVDPNEEDIKKLIAVINKHIGPIIHKADTLKARIEFKNIISNYLTGILPCIQEYKNKVYLFKGKTPIVYFDQRIGTASKFGEAYLNMGKGFAKLLKFSCKIMEVSKRHTLETKLLEKMSQLAERGASPNMPITYKILKCNKICISDLCPAPAKKTSYYVVINELATYDLKTWFKETHTPEAYESIIMQVIFAIFALHNLGYSHNDCHLGNFLVHKIKPGGYWRYTFNDENIYIPNCGYLLVLWDPGMASLLNFKYFDTDYKRVLKLINDLETKYYKTSAVKKIPDTVKIYMMNPIILAFTIYKSERDALWHIIKSIKNGNIATSVKVGAPPGVLLNIKPYNMSY